MTALLFYLHFANLKSIYVPLKPYIILFSWVDICTLYNLLSKIFFKLLIHYNLRDETDCRRQQILAIVLHFVALWTVVWQGTYCEDTHNETWLLMYNVEYVSGLNAPKHKHLYMKEVEHHLKQEVQVHVQLFVVHHLKNLVYIVNQYLEIFHSIQKVLHV